MNDLVFVPVDEAEWQTFGPWWLGNEELQRCYTPPTRKYFDYVRSDPKVFARMVYEQGQPVGFVHVDRETDGTGYVGIVVKPELWNRGLGERILRALVIQPELSYLERLVAHVDVTNVRSQRCFTGAGFVQQGEEPDKDRCVAFVYTLTRDEC